MTTYRGCADESFVMQVTRKLDATSPAVLILPSALSKRRTYARACAHTQTHVYISVQKLFYLGASSVKRHVNKSDSFISPADLA